MGVVLTQRQVRKNPQNIIDFTLIDFNGATIDFTFNRLMRIHVCPGQNTMGFLLNRKKDGTFLFLWKCIAMAVLLGI